MDVLCCPPAVQRRPSRPRILSCLVCITAVIQLGIDESKAPCCLFSSSFFSIHTPFSHKRLVCLSTSITAIHARRRRCSCPLPSPIGQNVAFCRSVHSNSLCVWLSFLTSPWMSVYLSSLSRSLSPPLSLFSLSLSLSLSHVIILSFDSIAHQLYVMHLEIRR